MPAGVICQIERFYENKISWTPRQSSFISESFGHYHSVEVIRQKKAGLAQFCMVWICSLVYNI